VLIEKILLCKLDKRIKVVQITIVKYVAYVEKEAELFGNLALTLSAQLSFRNV
jgi:hypothetical protein